MASSHCSNHGQQSLLGNKGSDASGAERSNGECATSLGSPTTWDSLLAAVAQATPIAPARLLSPGSVAGEYQIESVLGQGGFGTVYRAVHPVIGKVVAVKVLREQYCTNPAVVTRFVEEGCAVNRIAHPNIVDIFGFGTLETGQQFLVMELLEGESLRDRLRREGAVEPTEALGLLREIASALDATHDQKVLHRDLKPENVFLVRQGSEGARAKLLDFGIAKVLEPHDSSAGATEGKILGTRAYMSPEQCVGAAVDARTDLYALGIVAYEMLTGAHPFETETVSRSDAHSRSRGVPAWERNAALPKAVDAPLARMFALDPEQRPTRASTAVEALAAAFGAAGASVTRPPEGPPRRWAVAFAGLAGVALAGYAWLTWPVAHRSAQRIDSASRGDGGLRVRPAPAVGTLSAPIAPAHPPLIAVALDVEPAQAQAYVGGQLVPRHEGVLRFERTERVVKLLIRAHGFVEQTIELTPDQDQRLRIRLSRIPTPNRASSKPGRLAPKTGELEF